MSSQILEAIVRVETKQETLIADVACIKEKMSTLPCTINTYKIKLLQRIVYGAVVIVCLAFMANLTDTNISKADEAKKAKAPVIYKVEK